jgi:hypothetical protein
VPTSDWPVGVDAVGSLLRARTRDTQGNEVGTFTGDTRPTDTQVSHLINTSLGDVSSVVGVDLLEGFWAQAAAVVSYRAAMLTELSYFPEQVATGRSPYEQLRDLYTESIKNLRLAVSVTGQAPGEPSPPSYAFPRANTLDVLLGPVPGGYVIPYNGGPFQ